VVVDAWRGAAGWSRRSFLRGAGITFVGGAPVLLAACGGGDDESAKPKPKPRSSDVDVLNTALDLEYTAVAVYTAGEPLLRGGMRALGRQFRDQEREHAAALVRAIKDLGGTPNKPRARYAMPALRDQDAFLTFVKDFEDTLVAAYLDALPKLSDPQLRAAAAATMTTEAEHISVLLAALGEPRVPKAFVSGEE
jgi:bacterioferritin (cytochrome b1)